MNRKRRHPAINVALKLLYTYRWTIGIYWLVFLCIYVAIGVILRSPTVGAEMDAQGIWEGASTSPKVFLLVIGILMTPLSLASFVSNGVTRRHFIWGVSGLLVVYSAISAIIMVIGYPIEQWIYDKYDWPLELSNPHLFKDASQFGLIFVEYFFLFIAFFGSGWLIGSCFYRFNWKLAVVLILVAILPAMAMETVISADWIGSILQKAYDIERASLAAVIPLALCIVALVFVSVFLLLRKVPVKRKVLS
ncbi:hypothetical protein [Paenibacillus harenae]|uniref:Uncharacterized protein n=1 Tax=Paenibacillus harenae TaxID=306543 RepID=A0ABT9UAM3_PAEHA|nr:hypothetical protein [Paenibacillus harenae]MDQ0115765.1 hypothetical protein [Paenibacillus harenae]